MLRRLTSFGAALALAVQLGCGGGDTPAPTAATGPVAPPTAPPVPPPGPAVAPTPAPAATDVYAMIPDTATGALAVRVPKLLASPFATSEAVTKIKEDMRAENGLEVEQVDEVIVVFTGTGAAAAGTGYNPTSPYSERGTTPNPYGPGNPAYGPTLGTPAAGNSQQAAMAAAMGPMMATPESTVVIVRANVPLDQTKIRELSKVDATEIESGEYKYFKATDPNSPSISFFDDKTLIMGRESTLLAFFTPAATTPPPQDYAPRLDGSPAPATATVSSKLGDAMRTAAPELAIHGTMKMDGLKPSALPAGGENAQLSAATMAMSSMATTIPRGSFSLDLTTGAKLVIDLEAANAEAAQQVWVNLQSAQGTINTMMGLQKMSSPPDQTPEQKALREKGFAAWDQFSKTMKVEKGGADNMHVLVSGSLDQPMVESLAAMMKRDLLMPPGSPQALAVVESQMKQIGVAAIAYLEKNAKLPTAAIMSADGKPLLSWRVALLPHLGQQELFDQFKLDEPWDSEHNKALVEKMPSVYSVPGVSDPGKTTLLAPISDKTVFGNKEGATLVMASDGASYTILLVQANADKAVTWTAPDDLTFDAAKPTAGLDKTYPGVFLALWLDGAVRSIALDTEKATTAGLFTYAGGESPVDLTALATAAATAATRTPAGATADTTTETASGEKTYDEGWAGDAQRAIDRGHDKEAARLALAAALLNDDDALAEGTMHWTKLGTPKPVHFLRFGVGAMPDPKRRKETTNPGGGLNGFGGPSSTTSDEEETDPAKQFDDLAADVGREMVAELRDMLDDGDFGKLFEYERQKTDDGSGSSRIAGMRLETGGAAYGPRAPGSTSTSTPGTPDEVAEQASRGLVILGSGDRKTLQDAAVEAEVDVLLIAEITTKNNRSTDPAVEFTLTDVATKKRFAQSDPIPLPSTGGSASYNPGNNSASSATADADSRKKNMAKWLSTFESTLKFKEVPKLPADKVLTQATKVVGAGKQKNPLPLLLELRFYQALGALKPDEALPLVQKVVGDEAKAQAIVTGTPEERKAALEEYVLPVPTEPGVATGDDS
jgi:hypothetical protein